MTAVLSIGALKPDSDRQTDRQRKRETDRTGKAGRKDKTGQDRQNRQTG